MISSRREWAENKQERGKSNLPFFISRSMFNRMSQMTIFEIINRIADRLRDSVDKPRSLARDLVGKYLNLAPNDLIAIDRRQAFPSEAEDAIWQDVERIVAREPHAYVLGETYFYGLPFKIGPGVLIPRPDTEVLVEEAVAYAEANPVKRILELCLGSACISIAVLDALRGAKSMPTAVGTEISELAIGFAEMNRKLHGFEEQLDIVQTDLFPESGQLFDMLMSNPPYIDAADMRTLDESVMDHEPHLALSGGDDGLDFYRRIYSQAPAYLTPGAVLICEHGYAQRDAITAIIQETGYYEQIRYRDDYAGRARVVLCRYKNQE